MAKKLVFSGLVLGSMLLLASVRACSADNDADGVSVLKQVSSIELPGPPGKRFPSPGGQLPNQTELAHKLYTSDERANALAVVDVRNDTVLTTLHFQSETGVPLYDPVAKRVYVNLQDLNEFAVIDPQTDNVVGHYPVEGCTGNHGMALDIEQRRAFLACQGNSRFAIFDLVTHKAIATLPLPPGADVVQFDPGLRRIYMGCSSGAISVFQEDDPDHFRKLADVPVQRRVHSLAVDVRTHRVYGAEQRRRRPRRRTNADF